ncbi:putative adenylate cyclase [Streptomyces scabiei 87.22]|uniref:Putative adenylate cyclase n=1 Tax=Streptomyces scabiei (strain 87.22) TaxID=680198 RepID=C9ZFG4_STRSW|nr:MULTISPECIES: CYTH domain-containing protein [Streptomyces]MBP5868246.1 CYTH domain-containing protein [Streptomyces sp. LBUM 1485]MBP5915936.1 CYTH domain-containing protein [Streptomyces sp. LBUM 1486]MDX2579963.1 CYTH domain-containing protein [Streptomyces scabiei]MDX2650648.1 CYTH domain-containing protein [Streptomyces scabiei]MDX2725681.1 CYTH domain-containing protein [Streptomyces scabiei]
MIEAELKARVRAPEVVARVLGVWGEGRAETYRDTYDDLPDGSLRGRDEELRLRCTADHGTGERRALLTFKAAAVDEESGSKPEYGTRVEDAQVAHAILRRLGYVPAIVFEKHCRSHSFEAYGRRMLATLVRVPELDGTFLEVESLVREEDEVAGALDGIRAVLRDLGIAPGDLTRESYTAAVAAVRGGQPRRGG